MKRYLLPQTGNFYKANLHSHSTDSDGGLTPRQLADGYRDKGYSVLAISDHQVFVDRADLCSDDFLVLNSVEYNPGHGFKTKGRFIHIGMIATSPDIKTMPDFPEFEITEMDNDEYTANVNKTVKMANDAGFLCIHNHMRWSLETDDNLAAYEGFFAMELYNGFSEVLGVEENNIATFLHLNRSGKPIYGIMADDNHNKNFWERIGLYDLDDWDTSFISWIVIKAPDLAYDTIITALKNGDFYASNGPEIYELYINDENKLIVDCSPAKCIALGCEHRRGPVRYSKQGGITHAEFDLIIPEEFVQVTITDMNGRKAATQVYKL